MKVISSFTIILFGSSILSSIGSTLLTFAAVADANKILPDDKKQQRKLISIEIATTDNTKLAALGDQEGLLTVEFVEPEEGIIFVLGTETESTITVIDADEAATSSSSWIQALKGDSLNNNDIDPVLLYQELSGGLPVPPRLQEANERRKAHVFADPLELPPLEEEEHDNNARWLQKNGGDVGGTSGSGACDGPFWEQNQCGYQAHTVNFCYCYSCRTGTGAVGGDAINMFVRGQAYRGSVTQRVKFWRCDPASGRDCRYKMLTAQTVSRGTIVTARGIGNGQLLTWRAQMDNGNDQGWNW
jgi:hypothetical protein